MPGSRYSNPAFVLGVELRADPHGPGLAGQSPRRPGQSGLQPRRELPTKRIVGGPWNDDGRFVDLLSFAPGRRGTTPSNRRFDVLVETEKVLRIVFIF